MKRRLNTVHRLALVLAAITACIGVAWLLSDRQAALREPVPVHRQVRSETTPKMPPQGESPIAALPSEPVTSLPKSEDMTSAPSDLHEIRPTKTVARQIDLSGPPTHGPGG